MNPIVAAYLNLLDQCENLLFEKGRLTPRLAMMVAEQREMLEVFDNCSHDEKHDTLDRIGKGIVKGFAAVLRVEAPYQR